MAASEEDEKMQEEINDDARDNKDEQDMEQDASDSSSDEEEENLKIKELRDLLVEQPFMYDRHMELINLLRAAGELDQCREARENMNKSFPLAPELWLSWIKDEQKFLNAESASEREKINKLFDRAVKDYLSVEVWLEYSLFAMGAPAGGGDEEEEESHTAMIHDVLDRALTAAGLHVSKGALLWTAYREYEIAVLAGLHPLPGSTASEEQQKAIDVQTRRINKLFHRQLSVPLRDMESTYEEYEEWCEVVDPSTEKAYKAALEKLELLEPFETRLESVSAEEQTSVYVEYLDEEMKRMDPGRIQCLFERAATDKCLEAQIWSKYLLYMERELRAVSADIAAVYERAVRNLPWCTELWLGYVRSAERQERSHHTVKALFDRALGAGLYGANDHLQVWTALLDYLRRGIEWDEHDYEKDLEEFRTTLERALRVLQETFPQAQGLVVPLMKYGAWIEAKFCKNMERSRDLWNDSIKQLGANQAQTWLEFIQLERAFGDRKHARKLFQRAMNSVNDWPEGVVDAFINFEREEGSLEQYDQAVERCANQMKRINSRRAEIGGRYTYSPELSGNYHRLFDAQFPPPPCVAYSGMEGGGDDDRDVSAQYAGQEEPIPRKFRGFKPRKSYGQRKPLTVDSCEKSVRNVTLFFRKGTPLSNFYPCRFIDPADEQVYTSSEQYYQAAKAMAFKDEASYNIIMQTSNQVKMKQQGDRVQGFNQAKWRKTSRDVLLRACRLKFQQNEELGRHLLNTRKLLAEASPTDHYWGIGLELRNRAAADPKSWKGKNVMGEILMEVKSQLCGGGGGGGGGDLGNAAATREGETSVASVRRRVIELLKVHCDDDEKPAEDDVITAQDDVITAQDDVITAQEEIREAENCNNAAMKPQPIPNPSRRHINIERSRVTNQTNENADVMEPVLELHPNADDSYSLSPMKPRAEKETRVNHSNVKKKDKSKDLSSSEVQSPDREIASPDDFHVDDHQTFKVIRQDMVEEDIQCPIQSPIHSPIQCPSRQVQSRDMKTITPNMPVVIQTEMPGENDEIHSPSGDIHSPVQSPSRELQSPDHNGRRRITRPVPVKLIQTEMLLESVPSYKQNRASMKLDQSAITVPQAENAAKGRVQPEKSIPEYEKEKLNKMKLLLGSKAVEEGEKAVTEQKQLEVNVLLSQVLKGSINASDRRTVKAPNVDATKVIGAAGKGETRKLVKDQVVPSASKRTVLLKRPTDVREVIADTPTESVVEEVKQIETVVIPTRMVVKTSEEGEEDKPVRKTKRNTDFSKVPTGVFAKAIKDVAKTGPSMKLVDYDGEDSKDADYNDHEDVIVKEGSKKLKGSEGQKGRAFSLEPERKVVQKLDASEFHMNLSQTQVPGSLNEISTMLASSPVPAVSHKPVQLRDHIFPITGSSIVRTGGPIYKCPVGTVSSGRGESAAAAATAMKLPVYGAAAAAASMEKADGDKISAAASELPVSAIPFPKRKIQRKWMVLKEDTTIDMHVDDALAGGDSGGDMVTELAGEKTEQEAMDQSEKAGNKLKTDDEELEEFIQERVKSELVGNSEEFQSSQINMIDDCILLEDAASKSDSAPNTAEKKKKKKHKKEKKHKKDKKKKKRKKHRSDSDSSPERRKLPVTDSEDTSPVKSKNRRYSESEDYSSEKGRSRRYSDDDSSPDKYKSKYRSPLEKKRRRKFVENPSPERDTKLDSDEPPPNQKAEKKRQEDMTEEELLIMLNMGELEESPPSHNRGYVRGRYHQQRGFFRGRRPFRGRWNYNRGRGAYNRGGSGYNPSFRRSSGGDVEPYSKTRKRSRSRSRSQSRGRSSSSSRSRSSDPTPKKRHLRRRRSHTSSEDQSKKDKDSSGSSDSSTSSSEHTDSDTGHSKRTKKTKKSNKKDDLPLAYRVADERDRARSRSWSYSKTRKSSRSRSRDRSTSRDRANSGRYYPEQKQYGYKAHFQTPDQRGYRNHYDQPPYTTGPYDHRKSDFSPRFYTPQSYRGRYNPRHQMPPFDPNNPLAQASACERYIEKYTLFFRKGTPLSNYFQCEFKDEEGTSYCSTEQYYQYHKAKMMEDDAAAEEIIRTKDQAQINYFGANIKAYHEGSYTWRNKHARAVLKEGLYLKFSQNPILKGHLLKTNDVIAEANNRDDFFAIGVSMFDPHVLNEKAWKGKNILGKLLMDLKAKFQDEED